MATRLSKILNDAIGRQAKAPGEAPALVERMAREAGIEPGTVQQILRGEIETPPRERLAGFARVLGVSLETLTDAVGGDETAVNRVELGGVALNMAGAGAPEWVQLTPAGPDVEGRDGRKWFLPNPEQVVAAFNAAGMDLPVDLEHSTVLKGAKGEPAPAVGWIKAMEVRNGALWGRVEWTEDGARAVASRSYRYLSPVFTFTKAANQIVEMLSAGLTNQPNLRLAALNRAANPNNPDDPDPTLNPDKGRPMNLTRITKALGLDDGASTDQIETAVNRLITSADQPDISKFVPKAEYDTALNRATEAEAKLAERDKSATDTAINSALDAAVAAGKITPGSRGFYEAACRAEGGLDKFNTFVEGAPKIAEPSNLDKVELGGKTKLTADEVAACRAMGMSEADFIEAKKEG